MYPDRSVNGAPQGRAVEQDGIKSCSKGFTVTLMLLPECFLLLKSQGKHHLFRTFSLLGKFIGLI